MLLSGGIGQVGRESSARCVAGRLRSRITEDGMRLVSAPQARNVTRIIQTGGIRAVVLMRVAPVNLVEFGVPNGEVPIGRVVLGQDRDVFKADVDFWLDKIFAKAVELISVTIQEAMKRDMQILQLCRRLRHANEPVYGILVGGASAINLQLRGIP